MTNIPVPALWIAKAAPATVASGVMNLPHDSAFYLSYNIKNW